MFAKLPIDGLRYYDGTFSNTAEHVVAALLVIALVVTTREAAQRR